MQSVRQLQIIENNGLNELGIPIFRGFHEMSRSTKRIAGGNYALALKFMLIDLQRLDLGIQS